MLLHIEQFMLIFDFSSLLLTFYRNVAVRVDIFSRCFQFLCLFLWHDHTLSPFLVCDSILLYSIRVWKSGSSQTSRMNETMRDYIVFFLKLFISWVFVLLFVVKVVEIVVAVVVVTVIMVLIVLFIFVFVVLVVDIIVYIVPVV